MGSNPTQTLHQTIQQQFGLQNPSDSSKSSNDKHTTQSHSHRFVIPQLRIPQLQLQQQQQQQPHDLVAQERSRQATDAHNQQLLNEIRRRRLESESEVTAAKGAAGVVVPPRFVIPQLGAATGEPLNIPLLAKLERGVGKLQLRNDDDGGDRAAKAMKTTQTQTPQSPLIDLTCTVIPGSMDGPPKVAASKAREKLAASQEHFSIPFNPCDTVRKSPVLSGGILASRHSLRGEERDEDAAASVPPPGSRPGPIACMLDTVVGYPEPRKPQLQFAITLLERRHLKMCAREDYGGGQVKRFRFDTPSPDELVKQALQKSWRVTRT